MPRSASFLASCCSISAIGARLRSASALSLRAYHLVGFRVELAKRKVLELLAHLMHAHAAGKRRIDFQRFFGGALARFMRHVIERAHVVQPVGELDQQHPHIVGDREQQLAQVLGLLRLLGDEIESLQLGEAFDQRADVVAEQAIDLGASRFGVLDGVVQEGRRDGGVVELEVRQDGRDLDRMGEIGIARSASLFAMCFHGIDVGAIEESFVGVGIVAAHPFDEVVLPHHWRFLRRRLFDHLLSGGSAKRQWRPCGRLLLHPRQIRARLRHNNHLAAAESARNGRRRPVYS